MKKITLTTFLILILIPLLSFKTYKRYVTPTLEIQPIEIQPIEIEKGNHVDISSLKNEITSVLGGSYNETGPYLF